MQRTSLRESTKHLTPYGEKMEACRTRRIVTFNGNPVGLLKSIRPYITEIVISTSYCGCEFVNGELASVEILKEPLDKWEEQYGKTIDDSKAQ